MSSLGRTQPVLPSALRPHTLPSAFVAGACRRLIRRRRRARVEEEALRLAVAGVAAARRFGATKLLYCGGAPPWPAMAAAWARDAARRRFAEPRSAAAGRGMLGVVVHGCVCGRAAFA